MPMRSSNGRLERDIVECPLHGRRFAVKTGNGLGAPIIRDLEALPVRIEGNAIRVNVGSRLQAAGVAPTLISDLKCFHKFA